MQGGSTSNFSCRAPWPQRGHRRRLGALCALALTLLVGGCLEQPPVLLRNSESGAGMAPYAGQYFAFTAAGEAAVEPGDTVYSFARRHNVPLRAVIDLNHLTAPYALEPGRKLSLPAVEMHEVQHGETLYGISHASGANMYAVAQANGLAPPYRIRIGQRLVIPKTVVAASPPPPAAGPQQAAGPGPQPASGPQPAAGPLPGVVTGEVAPSSPSQPQPPPPPPEPLAPPQPAAPPEPEAPAQPAPPPPSAAGSVAAVPQTAVPGAGTGAEKNAALFIWPAYGPIISHFGAKQGGLRNDGINIAVPLGTPVKAVQDGVVAYAGNELRGYGNLLLVRHADGFLTAYAHNETLLVHCGETVRRGQVIARSGESGSVSTPQLHFEIRRGTEPVNPLDYLPHLAAMTTRGASGS